MDGILGKAETDEQRLYAERLLEGADDRDRTARIEWQGTFAEGVEYGLLGSLVCGHIGRCDVWHASVQEAHLDLDALRGDSLEVLLEESCDLAEVLIRNQTHRYLGRGLRWNDGLRTLLGIAAPDSVHVERGTHSGALHGVISGLALDVADGKRALVVAQ